jgi:hypothetical protein
MDGLLAHWAVEGSFNSDLFMQFLREKLVSGCSCQTSQQHCMPGPQQQASQQSCPGRSCADSNMHLQQLS